MTRAEVVAAAFCAVLLCILAVIAWIDPAPLLYALVGLKL